ncbi:hypothetical protein ACJ41O_000992 [Fusarium nematophilum]
MSPSNAKLAAGGAFHTFQGVIPKKQPAPASTARSRVAGARRITTPHACTECKRRKIRCDGKQPCGQCITSRAPKSCCYDKHRQRLIPSRKALDTLSQSLEECRSVLRRLYPNHEVSALLPLTTQELMDLLAQPHCGTGSALPSPPLETAVLNQDASIGQPDTILQLPSSLETDLDTLIGELEFEMSPEAIECGQGASFLAQPTWWDMGSKQWDSIQVPSLGEDHVYGAGAAGVAVAVPNSAYKDDHSIYGPLGLSHMLCIECAHQYGVVGEQAARRETCPACHLQLTMPDGAVIMNLNPSEEYKSTVLSGLSPNIIMDCASRALSFWAYQVTQELRYEKFQSKELNDKYTSLNLQLENTTSQSSSELEVVRHRLTNLQAEQESLRLQNAELRQSCKDQNRRFLQLQDLYDKLKGAAEMAQIQKAAAEAIGSTLGAAASM